MEENKEEVVEETTQQPVDETTEQESPVSINEDGDYKIDLTKVKQEDAVQEPETNDSDAVVGQPENEESSEEVVEEVQSTVSDEEQPVEQPVQEEEVTQDELAKLKQFMEETGGSLDDYVRLNTDVNELDDSEVLQDYYKRTKPHLNNEEINFMLEDQFSYDEDEADDKEIRRKKLALKEQVAEAKAYLDGQKSKYYEEIKAGSKLTEEQQKAIDFFNRYNKESEQTQKVAERQKLVFNKKTEQLFGDKFKGFEYNVGDKKFRYNVKNADQVKKSQSDINNFVRKFLAEDNTIGDAKGYHKGLFTAMNADAIAQHFYEQGKADAIKDSVTKAKNVNTGARSTMSEPQGAYRVKVLGDDSSSFKFKMKNKK